MTVWAVSTVAFFYNDDRLVSLSNHGVWGMGTDAKRQTCLGMAETKKLALAQRFFFLYFTEHV